MQDLKREMKGLSLKARAAVARGGHEVATRLLDRLLGDEANAGRLRELALEMHDYVTRVEDKARAAEAESALGAEVDFNGQRLAVSIRREDPPWAAERPRTVAVPGMISAEEAQYYRYVCGFYSGAGDAVELGPWLGHSTHHIVDGLRENPRFGDRLLYVYDDFVWRPDWMDPAVQPEERLPRHADFRATFERYSGELTSSMAVTRARLSDYDGNAALPQATWHGGPIELIFADCGRTYDANEAWWRIFAPAFLPGRTLVIMQDWGTHRELPPRWYNQTLQFVESKAERLRMVHDLKHGDAAGFLYV